MQNSQSREIQLSCQAVSLCACPTTGTQLFTYTPSSAQRHWAFGKRQINTTNASKKMKMATHPNIQIRSGPKINIIRPAHPPLPAVSAINKATNQIKLATHTTSRQGDANDRLHHQINTQTLHWQLASAVFHHCELRIWVWRLGIPISQEFTLAANRNEQRDSPVEDASGDRFTNISVFESPPRHGCVAKSIS